MVFLEGLILWSIVNIQTRQSGRMSERRSRGDGVYAFDMNPGNGGDLCPVCLGCFGSLGPWLGVDISSWMGRARRKSDGVGDRPFCISYWRGRVPLRAVLFLSWRPGSQARRRLIIPARFGMAIWLRFPIWIRRVFGLRRKRVVN